MKTRTHTDTDAAQNRRYGVALYDAPVYMHTSTFSSDNLELTVRSPRIRYVDDQKFVGQPIPVFGPKDSVGGSVTAIVPRSTVSTYELVISIEGAFYWIGPQKEELQILAPSSPLPERIKHVFLSSNVTVPIVAPPVGLSKRRMKLRHTFPGTILRRSFRKSGREVPGTRETQDMGYQRIFHSFTFQLPDPPNHNLPTSVSVSRLKQSFPRGRWYAEGAQVAYKVTVDMNKKSFKAGTTQIYGQLEAPVFIDSADGEGAVHTQPGASDWSDFALTCPTPLPFQSYLFIPESATFTRSDVIPFYISFVTFPRSAPLAHQIMEEASINVKLIRSLRMEPASASLAPIPRIRQAEQTQNPPTARREPASGILRRVVTNASNIFIRSRRRGTKRDTHIGPKDKRTVSDEKPSSDESPNGKPLPPLPHEHPILFEDVICFAGSQGFKRCSNRKSLPGPFGRGYESGNKPDGFFKGELRWKNELSNTIDWPGLSLIVSAYSLGWNYVFERFGSKYIVEATVSFKDAILRTRREINIMEPYREPGEMG